jgi:hypothetical protein
MIEKERVKKRMGRRERGKEDSSCANGLWERRKKKENEVETERVNEIEGKGGRKS